MDRPITTLFMLMSVDGKISTGSTDELDVDRDFPKLPGVREDLHQYYEIEQTTDLWSFNTGRVQAKMGVNEQEIREMKEETGLTILDPRLVGVKQFSIENGRYVVLLFKATQWSGELRSSEEGKME